MGGTFPAAAQIRQPRQANGHAVGAKISVKIGNRTIVRDVQIGAGQTYQESKRYAPGEKAVVTRLPWAKLGITICYDMRFPGLYRDLAQAGAQFMAVPSAFTVPTGTAHWHTLLRARAIESQCFVLAAAQTGQHKISQGRIKLKFKLIRFNHKISI